jgi:hypothetical protein
MKRWITVVLLILVLVGLGLSTRIWLPPILAFVGANSDLIQGVQAAVQIILWVGAAVIGVSAYLRHRQSRDRAADATSLSAGPQINTGGGAIVAGNANAGRDFVGRDKILAASGDRSVVIGGDASGVFIITGDGISETRPADSVPPAVLLRAYYLSLAGECRQLPLGVVDPRFLRPQHDGEVSLPDVYVDLAVVSPARGETRRHTPGDYAWRAAKDLIARPSSTPSPSRPPPAPSSWATPALARRPSSTISPTSWPRPPPTRRMRR